MQVRPGHFSRFHSNTSLHLFTSQYLSRLNSNPCFEVWCHTRLTVAITAKSPGQRSWKGTHTPNCTLYCQTSRLHSVKCSHVVLHHSRTARFFSPQSSLTPQLCHRHWLRYRSHSKGSCYPERVHFAAFCLVVRLGTSRSLLHTCLCPHTTQHVAASPFSVFLTTRVSGPQHYIVSNSYKLVRAPRRLCSYWPPHRSPTAQRSPGSASSPQLPHSAISSQVPAGPTSGDVMSISLAVAATQLSFFEFLQRCNLLIAPPPRPQPSPPFF